MKDRIRFARKQMGLNQTDFGETLGVTLSAVQKWEAGTNTPTNAVLTVMAQKSGVSEVWLRTGAGEPFPPTSRKEELTSLFGELMADRPEAFRSRVISALLRFDPSGKEWDVLEHIYNGIEAENKKD